MTGFAPLFIKEMKEQMRTFKAVAFVAVLALLGVGGMVALAFLPELLRLSDEVTPGIPLPEFTAPDALASYDSSVVQIGLLTVVLLAMGSVARERERKTALLVLARPVTIAAYVLSKMVAQTATVVAGTFVIGAVAYLYAIGIFEGTVSVSGALAMIAAEALFLTYVTAVTIGASCLFRNMLPAALAAFAVLMVIAIASALPWIGGHLPGAVTSWGLALMRGQEAEPRWSAVAVTMLITVAALAIGCWRLSRTEV